MNFDLDEVARLCSGKRSGRFENDHASVEFFAKDGKVFVIVAGKGSPDLSVLHFSLREGFVVYESDSEFTRRNKLFLLATTVGTAVAEHISAYKTERKVFAVTRREYEEYGGGVYKQYGTGICANCGKLRSGVKPQAIDFFCDPCGTCSVYGIKAAKAAGIIRIRDNEGESIEPPRGK